MWFFSRKQPSKAPFDAPLAPDRPFFVIGDVHGRDDLLDLLLGRLGSGGQAGWPVICAGDYVDRGDFSAQVLRRLFQRQSADPDLFVCLMGNHERMMLDFLDAPAVNAARWLPNGGLQTLASFDVAPARQTARHEDWEAVRDDLRAAVGPELEAWLRALPLSWQSGNVFVTHAAADPAKPVSAQRDETLLWGHPDFTRTPRNDAIWVVHGHTIVDQAVARDGRISIDTGAYATDVLTAAQIEPGRVAFIST